MNQRQSRIFLTTIGVLTIGACVVLTFGLGSQLRERASQAAGKFPLVKCVGINSGDWITVERHGEEVQVRLVGIEAPRMEGDPLLAEQAARREMDVVFLMNNGQVSRNTLAAWIYRRNLELIHPDEEVRLDASGRSVVYADITGLDIGARLLHGGQVFARDEDHPQRVYYEELEADARSRRVGVWRNP